MGECRDFCLKIRKIITNLDRGGHEVPAPIRSFAFGTCYLLRFTVKIWRTANGFEMSSAGQNLQSILPPLPASAPLNCYAD
jgi:hypothetical protein